MKKLNTQMNHSSNDGQNVAISSLSRATAMLAVIAASLHFASTAAGQNAFFQTNLVSDLPGYANRVDTNLVNPWGIVTSASSPFWINDNGTGLSTVYNSSATSELLKVIVPPPAGSTNTSAPSGIVFNTTTNFLANTNASKFIFDTEDGTISAWASGSAAVLKVDNSLSNAVYKGLALASNGGNPYLYAADFHNAQIDVYDGNWNPATLSGNFSDTNIPAGFAPFNIRLIEGNLYVTYALQDAEKHDDVAGPGNGYVDVFDTGGNLLQRLISQGALNSPWGIALAPQGFGSHAGHLLVGNFGDGRINTFDPVTGAWLGALYTSSGDPFSEPGLWALVFGNGGSGGNPHTLYFTAGIAGPDSVESHGLFGALAPVAPSFVTFPSIGSSITLSWSGDAGPFALQMTTSLANPQWTTILTTTSLSATVTNNAPSAFFRVINQGD